MTSPAHLKKLMQSLLDLHKVRESLALDDALLALMQRWLCLLTDDPAPVQMQVLSRRQLLSVLEAPQAHAATPRSVWPTSVYAQLLAYLDQPQRGYQALSCNDTVLHSFPLQQNVVHKHALLVIACPPLTPDAVALITQCLQMFNQYAELIIENERDALTGLLNRKTFDQCVSKILLSDYKPEFRFPLHHYLVIFDIDFFKKINDSHGHLIGDEVLILLSRLMQDSFREGDLLFRFGGEEFVGVFSCAHEADIAQLLQRFQQALAAFRFPQVGQVTISIGCAKMTANIPPNTVLEHADEALYFAKEHGRNQICFYETLLQQGALKENAMSGDIELF